MSAPVNHSASFYLKQRINPLANRFEVLEALPDGSTGKMLCFASQKRLVLKEEVTFYADEARTQPVFSFKARNVMEVNGKYDVFDADGNQLAFFNKDWKSSMLRSTFHVEGPGYVGTGQERSEWFAIVRRFLDEIPFVRMHFDFTDSDGKQLLSIERQKTVRDRYFVTVPDERVDFRVAAALAVGMDILMQR